uniref:Ig-like domain-containing protein n=1 Tax=Oryzias melastigma TaxID=30732 RepID=A0A3B3CRQ1_ORYME
MYAVIIDKSGMFVLCPCDTFITFLNKYILLHYDVTLRCEDTNITKVSVLNWTRTDLQEDGGYVSFRMKPPADPEGQPESFRNRVSLNNTQMKDGDLSVVLKNVTFNDTGIYQCRVRQESDPSGSPLKLISSINLTIGWPQRDSGKPSSASGGESGFLQAPFSVHILGLTHVFDNKIRIIHTVNTSV